jgi:hypothetical protein
MSSDPAAEIGTAADVLAVDQAVAVANGGGYDWAVGSVRASQARVAPAAPMSDCW